MMRRRSLDNLYRKAEQRPAGYLVDVLNHAVTVNRDEGWYTLRDEDFDMLRKRWASGAPPQPASKLRAAARVTRRVARAARSIAKTSIGIDRATDEQVEARLNVCRQCPGSHAVWRDGNVFTCGPMLASMREAGTSGGCGCVLRKKARDLAEGCPFGWWPKIPVPHDAATD